MAITWRKISTARPWWKEGFLGRGVEKVEEGVGGINGDGKKIKEKKEKGFNDVLFLDCGPWAALLDRGER